MLIFCTSSGGGGNLAQRLIRPFGGRSFRLLLHTQALSLSRTTKYFFLPTESTRVIPPTVLKSLIWFSLSPKLYPKSNALFASLINVNFNITELPPRFNSCTSTFVPGVSPFASAIAGALVVVGAIEAAGEEIGRVDD